MSARQWLLLRIHDERDEPAAQIVPGARAEIRLRAIATIDPLPTITTVLDRVFDAPAGAEADDTLTSPQLTGYGRIGGEYQPFPWRRCCGNSGWPNDSTWKP